jgi:hypothetical protein
MLKPPMKAFLGRVVLNNIAAPPGAGPAHDAVAGRARPCDAHRPYDRALQHEPAE